MKSQNYLIGAIIIVILIIAGVYLYNTKTQKPTSQPQETASQLQEGEFAVPKKSAHWESNTPEHGSTLAATPINVVINFNFDLAAPSAINISKDGQDFAVGETIIDDNKLSMRTNMQSGSPDGIYTVIYKACWPDGSCHDGMFQFKIDKSKLQSFQDERGKEEVTVRLPQISFMPEKLLVTKGTKITWINDEEIEHYVNTDSHPAHTYFLEQNSQALALSDNFSLVFNTPGSYSYHCSAHESSMKGEIVVED